MCKKLVSLWIMCSCSFELPSKFFPAGLISVEYFLYVIVLCLGFDKKAKYLFVRICVSKTWLTINFTSLPNLMAMCKESESCACFCRLR